MANPYIYLWMDVGVHTQMETKDELMSKLKESQVKKKNKTTLLQEESSSRPAGTQEALFLEQQTIDEMTIP